ncbi:MAG: ubiquinone/menaquinone biosynthesis methyltransferase [Vicinamibacterales bacterium]
MSSLAAAFTTPDAKRRHVRQLFATIADRYDLVTPLLSYGRDARWKDRLATAVAPRAGDRVLDLACGTGDIAGRLAAPGVRVCGLDITPRMLQLARAKPAGAACSWTTGDMTALPFADASFDVVTTGYGLRNVPDLDGAIGEIVRVLKPGGRFASLDFNRPDSAIVRAVYLGYLDLVGGVLGWALHGDASAYRYIPASIRRYPGAPAVARRLAAAGLAQVSVFRLLGGLMSLHVGTRAT